MKIKAALEAARHELATLHGLIAADGAEPTETWTLDESSILRQLDAAIQETVPASQSQPGATSQSQMSTSPLPSQSDQLPSSSLSHCEPNPENHAHPRLAVELLLKKAGLVHYGRLDLLEDRLLWIIRSDKGLALLNSPSWPPAFLLSQSPGEDSGSDQGRVSSGNLSAAAAAAQAENQNSPEVKG